MENETSIENFINIKKWNKYLTWVFFYQYIFMIKDYCESFYICYLIIILEIPFWEKNTMGIK